MNNFDLHEQATTLADTETAYSLAKRVVKLEQEKKRIVDLINSDNLSDDVDDYFFKKWVLSIWGD